MNKFWKWMEKTEYTDIIVDLCLVCKKNCTYIPVNIKGFPQQMLIGYMYEYLMENFNSSIAEFPIVTNITELYKTLVETIKVTNTKKNLKDVKNNEQ